MILQQRTKEALEGFPLTWRVDAIRLDSNAPLWPQMCHVSELFLARRLERSLKKKSHGTVTYRLKVKVIEIVNIVGFTDACSCYLGSEQEVWWCFPEVKVTRVTLDLWACPDDGALQALEVATTQIHIEIWRSWNLVDRGKRLYWNPELSTFLKVVVI